MVTQTTGERLAALDVLRGIAILGILFMNMIYFGGAYAVAEDPSLLGSAGGPGWTPGDASLGAAIHTGLEGSMRGLLSLLFGAGILMVTRAGDPVADRADLYYRRTIALVLMGVAHGYLLLWPGDILLVYGLAGLFLFPWRNVPPARLLAAGLLVVAGLGLASLLSAIGAAASAPEADLAAEALERLASERELRAGGYLDNLALAAEKMEEFNTWSALVWWVADAFGFMLIGMALFKWRVLDGSRPLAFYLTLAIAGYAIGAPIRALEAQALLASDFQSVPAPFAGLSQPARLAMTLGHLGLILAVLKAGPGRALLFLFRYPGRMALSVYLGTSIVCAILFAGFGFDLGFRLTYSELMATALAIDAGMLVLAALWIGVLGFRYGPAEWLWRSFSYGAWQKFR